MKLGEKILKLRKQKGLSQEELGEKVGVTRQTISNWELGESLPNPDGLKQLSRVFNVSIDELLDNDIQNILVEKVSNTEKLSSLILKIIIILIIGFVIYISFVFINKIIEKSKDTGREIEESIYCNIYGESHGYSIKYAELTGKPLESGGDSYFYDILDLGKYNDAHQIFNIINDYVKKNGGSCNMIENKDLNDLVNIEIKDLTNTGMRIIIHDTNPNRIVYGSDFWIEKYINGNWNSIYETGENYAFDDMAYFVNNDGILEMNQNWMHMYGELPKGIYRIIKKVFFESDIPINDSNYFYIWQEFEIK